MSSSFGAELRIDANDGNPYTLQSFLDTYPNGQELWDAAELWKSDGILRIRTAQVERAAAAGVVPQVVVGEENTSPTPAQHEFNVAEFPAISPAPCAARSHNGPVKYAEAATTHVHYSSALSPVSEDRSSMSPDAMEFSPGAETHTTVRYAPDGHSTNEEFETLPEGLWSGTENFPQPIADEEKGCVDWEMMIHTWAPEQWHEFGIKYFYGYIQQSSLLMDAMPVASEEHNDSCCSADHTCVANLWR